MTTTSTPTATTTTLDVSEAALAKVLQIREGEDDSETLGLRV